MKITMSIDKLLQSNTNYNKDVITMTCNESISFSNASIGACYRGLGHRGVHKAKMVGTNITLKLKSKR